MFTRRALISTRTTSLPITSSASPLQSSYAQKPQRRYLHARNNKIILPAPSPTPFVPDTTTFLTLIGRSLSQHASKFPTWESLFAFTPEQLRELGIEPPRTRRYLLRWRDKFRHGEFGIGGDAQHVNKEDGRVELRSVEIPVGGQNPGAKKATLTKSPGRRRVVVNVPPSELTAPESKKEDETQAENKNAGKGSDDAEANQESGLDSNGAPKASTQEAEASSTDMKPADPALGIQPQGMDPKALSQYPRLKGVSRKSGFGLHGSNIKIVKGTKGTVGVLKVQEGLWEHRRGHKVDGGERRKAEVRAKRRQAERKAAGGP
ncbi:MAG: hypothetical protein M1831_004832 [Alyxoria varia]|nr:MAG: hypothetical protein M1831_004832 [Alyxoria varia]